MENQTTKIASDWYTITKEPYRDESGWHYVKDQFGWYKTPVLYDNTLFKPTVPMLEVCTTENYLKMEYDRSIERFRALEAAMELSDVDYSYYHNLKFY